MISPNFGVEAGWSEIAVFDNLNFRVFFQGTADDVAVPDVDHHQNPAAWIAMNNLKDVLDQLIGVRFPLTIRLMPNQDRNGIVQQVRQMVA